jgi:AsmA protein
MRRVLIVIGSIVAAVLVCAGIFVATFNVNRYRGEIQTQLEQHLGRKVSLGDMHLHLFPPSFSAQDLSIAEDPAFSPDKPFVQTQELDVAIKLLPLLKGSVEIDSLNLKRPTVELIRNEQGAWNFASVGQPAQPTTPSASTSSYQVSLAKLAITDGQVALTDLQAKKPRAVYDHIDISLLDFAPNAAFSFDVAAHLPGAGTQQIRLQGQAGPIVAGQPAATPFHGTLDLQQVGIAGLQKFLDSPAMEGTDGVLSGQTKLGNESGKLTASGQMNVQDAKVHGLALGYPISMDYDVTDDMPADLLTVRSTTVKLGSMPILLSGTVNTKPTPPQLDVHVKVNSVSITDAAKLAAASGVAFSPGATIVGNISADIQAKGPADKPALSGTFSGSDVQISGKEIAQPVSVKSINLAFTPSDIHSDNFNVTSGGTTVGAQFAVRDYQSKSPLLDATLHAPNAALPEILSMAKAYGVTGLDKINGTGTLNINLHVAGPVQAMTSANKIALNGTIAGRDLQFSGKEIPQPVQIKAVNLTLTPTDIHSDNFNVTTGGTTVATQFAVRQYLAKSPTVDATVKATNAGLTEILALAKAYGVQGLDKISGGGTLSMDMRATGPVLAMTSDELTKALNGTLNLNFSNVRYTGTDIGYQLASIGGFLKSGEKDQGATNISSMTGNIAITSGVAQTSNLLAALDIGNVSATGTVNLVNQALNLGTTAVLSKDFSQRAGGSAVGGYMNTALSNSNGELVIPAIVTGTIANPKFLPDVKKIAQMKLKGLVPSLGNPGGGVAGILGGFLGQKGGAQTQQQPQANQQQPATTQQQSPQQDPVQGIIGLFGKKKQQQQTPPK